MMGQSPGRSEKAIRMVSRLGLILVVGLALPGFAVADEPCQARRALDPRTARLQALDVHVTRNGIIGRIKNTSSETALGVMVWVNYFLSRRGGYTAQQCIPVGDIGPGEEREFLAPTSGGAERAEAFTYTVDAVGWR